MSGINQVGYNKTNAVYDEENKATNNVGVEGKKAVKGSNTYGNPKLSEGALKYYNELVKKYGNLNFILVDSEKKEEAEMMKGSFANGSNLTVLIDTDKIEQMATDEAFRKKYESILSNATVNMAKVSTGLGVNGQKVRSYGMSFNKEGVASFFAVIDKSLAAQKQRISQKAKTKKEEEIKKEKEKAKERLEEETTTITADSIEELFSKINDYYMEDRTNYVRTEEEKLRGQKVDFSI